ncbi:MAG: PrsW family intramembrane metalloprotease [Treponema sp.]|nr:PrsW family intramembrane metalloprotease [Treponema sp.]
MIIYFFILWFGVKIKPLSLLLTCLLGLVAVLPTSLIQYGVSFLNIPAINQNSLVYSFVKSILIYGLIEEVNKCFFMFFVPKKELDNLKILLVGMFFGLSLASFESCVYYLDHLQMATSRGAEMLYVQIFVRIFTSDVIHLTCAGIGCLFVANIKEKVRISYLFTIILIHGLYDFFAGFTNKLHLFIIPIILLACLECRIKYKNLEEE